MGSLLKIALSVSALTFAWWTYAAADGLASLEKTFSRAALNVGKLKIDVFVADTDPKRSLGLMGIESLPENTGMLFVFEQETAQSFWMKNTIMDLSIGFFSAAGELIDIQEMKATSVMDQSPPSYQSKKPAMFALEMNKGWFGKHNVIVGARLQLAAHPASQLLNTQLSKPKHLRQ